jgi:hypothetical protein
LDYLNEISERAFPRRNRRTPDAQKKSPGHLQRLGLLLFHAKEMHDQMQGHKFPNAASYKDLLLGAIKTQ